jgi:hypothetical protein
MKPIDYMLIVVIRALAYFIEDFEFCSRLVICFKKLNGILLLFFRDFS